MWRGTVSPCAVLSAAEKPTHPTVCPHYPPARCQTVQKQARLHVCPSLWGKPLLTSPGQHRSLWIPACQTRETPQISQVDTLPRGHWNSAFRNAPTLFITTACITFTSSNTNKNLRVPVQPPVRLQGAGGCWTQVWGLRHSAPDTAKHPTAQPGRGSGMQTWSPNFLF